MKKRIQIGIIGCGKVAATRHLPALKSLKEAKVIALSDNDENRLNYVAKQFQIAKRYVDYRHLLHDSAIEAVGVCVPLQFHFETASATLDAGKHLLLEKPLTMTLYEADLLINQAAEVKRKVLVGFNMRWHRLVRQAQKIIHQELLGRIHMINMTLSTGHYNRYIPKWRLRRLEGGGSLIENGVHCYDLWHFLLQRDVEEIYAMTHSTEICDDEPAVVTARTADGVFLNCLLSDFLPDRNQIEIFGQKSILRISFHRFDGMEFVPLNSCDGDMTNRLWNVAHFFKEIPQGIIKARHGGDYNTSFRTQWKHFIDCIRRDAPVECTLKDGRKALQVALAAVKSASTAERVKLADAPQNILS